MVDANALQYATPDPQRDAADRLSRLHGALELKAALLALLLPAGSHRAVRAFGIETTDIRQAPGLLEHARQLEAGARLPWFEQLLGRMALHPLALRQELLQATRRVMSSRGIARSIDRLHWLAMRRALGEPVAANMRGAGAADVSEWSATDLVAIANYSAFLSRMVPVEAAVGEASPGSIGAAWYAQAMEPWQGGATLPGFEAPSGEVAIRALSILQTLALMQRPVLLRGWVATALKLSPGYALAFTAADALRLTCGLLDTPMPPELERQFVILEKKPK